jgi:hypothetical protein
VAGYVESASSVSNGSSSPSRIAASPALRLISLLALPTAAVLLTTLHYSMTEVWWLASAERMAGFDAAAPFQYRLLLPLLVAGVHAATAVDVKTLFLLSEVAAWILLVVVAYWALRMFHIGATDLSRRVLAMTVLVPVSVQLIIPDLRVKSLFVVEDGVLGPGVWHTTDLFRYVYDLPAAVFILALVLVLRRFVVTLEGRWFAVYLGLFAVAALNRETTVFLLPVFLAVCYRVLDHGTLARALLIQAVVFFAIQSGLHWLFAGNSNPHASVPGTDYENHLMNNLGLLSQPMYLLHFLVRFGVGLYLAVLLLHRHLDPFLSRTLLWFGIPFLASTLVFGRIQEHRVMVEVVPLLWLGAVQAITAYRARRSPDLSPDGDTAGQIATNGTIDERQAG